MWGLRYYHKASQPAFPKPCSFVVVEGMVTVWWLSEPSYIGEWLVQRCDNFYGGRFSFPLERSEKHMFSLRSKVSNVNDRTESERSVATVAFSKLLSATRTRLDMPGSNAPWSHTQLAWNASNVRTSIFKMFPSTWTVYQTCPNVQTLHVQHDHQAKSGLQRLRRTDVVGLCFPVKS